MEEAVKRNGIQVRRLSLIDVSSEDDSLITSDSLDHPSSENQEHRNVELSEAVDSNILEDEDTAGTLEHREHVPQPSESVEPEVTRKNAKYNLRKSLAWDSAFFTSAGVLEPDELSSIIEGVEKGEKHTLPGIQEEVHRSADSISTLESDCLTLESLEGDLFGDVRASIQKSSKVSSAANARSNTGSGVTETQSVVSSKKVDLASRSKIKPKPASIKPHVGLQGPGRMTKQVSACPQVSQSFATRGEPTPSLAKRPKVLFKDRPSSTTLSKRASISDKHVKMGKDNGSNASGKGAPLSRIPASGGSRNIVPRPAASSKSSSLGSSAASKTQPTISSSIDSSGSASSDNVSKSLLNSTKRKIESRTGQPPSFGATCKTPSRTASRNKAESGGSYLSTYLMSVSKLTPSTSPASSISEWSSESLSSSSTVKQRSNSSRASLDTTSCQGVSVDSDAPHVLDSQKHCNEQESVRHETQLTGLLGQCVKKASTGTGTLPHPASMRPSGLRLPSPKIGFFDGVKSAGRTPPGSILTHPVVPSGLPKIGAGNVTPSVGKAKIGKLQPARTPMATRSVKPDPQETSLNMKPRSLTPLQESSFSAIRGSTASRSAKRCPGISPKVQNSLCPKTGGESHLKTEEIEAEECDIGTCDSDVGIAEKSSIFDVLKDKVNSEAKGSTHVTDMKVTPINGGLNSSDSGSTFYVENVTLCPKVGEDAIYVQHNIENDLNLINSTIEKEEFKFEDQVNGLSRQVGAMDINKESQNKLISDSLSLSQLNVSSEDDSGALELSCQKRELHDCSQQGGNFKCFSKPPPSLSPTTFEMTSSTRTPFSVKDSFCNMDGSFDVSTGSMVVEVEKTATLTSLESSLKENI
ncbi:uncharacterized protein LOC133872246 isoform X2 [Alnus glutinosa]|uniref:uncharacterized protein LOC133872246 isoform X2 n=1 Tax=Alnus glutinosa TaxID=3517 RepID=UPI002D775CE5|nr:uncharacterized protein LOC133872246 isoform X2 [Alnus glutinosa]